MKLFVIVAVLVASMLPALPASASFCTGQPETTNNQSSLSSTTAGGQTCIHLYSKG